MLWPTIEVSQRTTLTDRTRQAKAPRPNGPDRYALLASTVRNKVMTQVKNEEN